MSEKYKKDDVPPTISGARDTSLSSAIFSAAKSAIGAGTLSLPSVLGALGLGSGVLLLTFASVTSTITLHFVSRLASNTDLDSYFAIGREAFGSLGEISAMVALVVYMMGALIFYLVKAAQFSTAFIGFIRGPDADPKVWFMDDKKMVILIALLTLPLSCLRNMSALGKASLLGMLCMAFILFLTVGDYFVDSAGRVPFSSLPLFKPVEIKSLTASFSNLLFAFINHFTVIATVPVLVNPSPKRRAYLTIISAIFVFLFYFLVSFFGYLHFGEAVGKNILAENTDAAGTRAWLYKIGSLLMGFVLILSYPLLLDPTRSTIDGAINLLTSSGKQPQKSLIRHLAITVSLIGVSSVIGICFPDQANTILEALTALSGSLLLFIFPCAYFLKLRNRYRVHAIEIGSAWGTLVFGLLFMIVGTFFGFKELIFPTPKDA